MNWPRLVFAGCKDETIRDNTPVVTNSFDSLRPLPVSAFLLFQNVVVVVVVAVINWFFFLLISSLIIFVVTLQRRIGGIPISGILVVVFRFLK